ncbi:MAG: hypothetical protein Kow00120_21390 [Anaerolineae bacterium]
MLSGLEAGFGLDIVTWLQAHGNGVFDALAVGLHLAGGELVYLALLLLIFWSVDRRLGIRLLFALLAANVTTEALKFLFQTPRPHIAHPEVVTPLVEQGGYGIPSGHVLIALVVWGYAALWLRRRAAWALAAAYVLLMAWARLYAGVHYPQDVVASLIFGAALLWLYARLVEAVAPRWVRLSLAVQLAVVVGVGVALAAVAWANEEGATAAGVVLGVGLGSIAEARWINFAVDGPAWQRAARYVVGALLVMGVLFGLRAAFAGLEPQPLLRIVRYALASAAGFVVWPWLCIRTGLMPAAPGATPSASDRQTDILNHQP